MELERSVQVRQCEERPLGTCVWIPQLPQLLGEAIHYSVHGEVDYPVSGSSPHSFILLVKESPFFFSCGYFPSARISAN